MPNQNPIKIAHVIVGLDVGGAERSLFRLIEAHRQSPEFAHRVISLTGKGVLGPQLESMGIEVTALGMRSLFDAPGTYFRLVGALRGNRPDVLQCWMYYADLLGGLAGRRLGIRKLFWGIRNSHFESGGTRLKRAIRKICAWCSYSMPTKIVCVAESALAVHAAAGYDRSRMIVIHNGYDPAQFRYDPARRLDLRRQWGLGESAVVIGSVGRYSAAKDHAGFIRAAAMLGRENESLRFVLIGRDLTAQNQAIAARINATGFPQRFILLGERSDIAACMSAFDVFCLHSKTEGFPNVLGEAMCIGLPCVATDAGDAKVLLGPAGRVVAQDSAAELAGALASTIGAGPANMKSQGERARQRIENHFTLRHAVDKFEALYRARA
jgi:glycosyltransferase involved in cell wall biosynthesis